MYSHGYNWREEPEGTSISSIVLLLVFVGATAFLLSMMYFRPWDDSPAAPVEVQVAPSPAPEAAAPAAAP
jgi:hypothetical protein